MKHTVARLIYSARRVAFPLLFSLLALGFAIPATTLAASAASAHTNISCGSNLSCVVNFGNQQIQNRLNVLNTLNGRVSYWLNKQAITGTQASALQSDVSTNESGLNALQSKLDAETSIQEARQDVHTMYDQFRIYAVVLPRDYRTIHADIAGNIDAKLQGMESDLQADINSAPSSEQQQLTSYYNNFVMEVNDAANDVSTAQNGLAVLTPANFNASPGSYEATQASVTTADQNAHKELHQCGYDLHQIEKVLG